MASMAIETASFTTHEKEYQYYIKSSCFDLYYPTLHLTSNGLQQAVTQLGHRLFPYSNDISTKNFYNKLGKKARIK